MLGLLRAFLTLLIAAVALHVIGLAWQQYYYCSVYFADARGLVTARMQIEGISRGY